jgi:hypothetical protein
MHLVLDRRPVSNAHRESINQTLDHLYVKCARLVTIRANSETILALPAQSVTSQVSNSSSCVICPLGTHSDEHNSTHAFYVEMEPIKTLLVLTSVKVVQLAGIRAQVQFLPASNVGLEAFRDIQICHRVPLVPLDQVKLFWVRHFVNSAWQEDTVQVILMFVHCVLPDRSRTFQVQVVVFLVQQTQSQKQIVRNVYATLDFMPSVTPLNHPTSPVESVLLDPIAMPLVLLGKL